MTLPVAPETTQLPAGAGSFRRTEAPPSAGTRKRKRLARKLARGTVLAAGLVALQFGALERERERLFDVHVLDRLEVPLTHYRE
jgi:hypothetical protein